jgi:predicted metal-dependent HD superfamily phosphohydrolase
MARSHLYPVGRDDNPVFRQYTHNFIEKLGPVGSNSWLISNRVDFVPITRTYHHTGHLARMLRDVSQFDIEWKPGYREAIEDFVMYHDYVYAGLASNRLGCEWYSAMAYYKSIKIKQEHAQLVCDAIMMTKYHTEDQTISDPIIGVCLDLDLMGLADPFELYLATSGAIRMEYAHVSDADFVGGRTGFLDAMLFRNGLFYSKSLRDRDAKHAAAVTNMEQELSMIEQNGEHYLREIAERYALVTKADQEATPC